MGGSAMAACWDKWTGRYVLSVATGAGAVYLLYRTIQAGLSCPPGGAEPPSIARECPPAPRRQGRAAVRR
uniref:Uncharacterized protein n=1 Tax=Nothoprocta perdicaria TaxID=30464 RepID=A0A8C6YXT4_NOTPE